MFGKLLKYDFKALLKTHLGMYIFLFVMSIAAVLSKLLDRSYPGNFFSNFFGPLFLGLFILGAIAVAVVSVVLGILRYRKNVLKDEGYLTNTLPVESWQIHISKLLVSSAYVYLTAIVIFLLSSLVVLNSSWMIDVYKDISWVMSEMYGNSYIFKIVLVVLAITPFTMFSNIYACMCIGYKSSKNKDAMSFVMYIVFYAINQTISFVLMIIAAFLEFGNIFTSGVLETQLSEPPVDLLNMIVVGSFIITMVITIVYNVLSVKMLDKNLNLE